MRQVDYYKPVKLISLFAFALLMLTSGSFCFGETKVEKVEFKGWKNNLKLSNGTVELIATLDVGPRVIRYGFAGGENMLEVESLGPLTKLQPGSAVEHREMWELHKSVAPVTDEALIDKGILPLVVGK